LGQSDIDHAKIERLEIELREKTQETKIASSKIRELQSSGNGLPIKRESVTLKPLKANPTERGGATDKMSSGRLPSVGRVGTNERNRRVVNTKTQPSSPVGRAVSKTVLETKKDESSLARKPTESKM
jgi:hypothetical protein